MAERDLSRFHERTRKRGVNRAIFWTTRAVLGLAIQFYFSHDAVMIRSAGPNKVWEDSRHPGSDDLYRTDTK